MKVLQINCVYKMGSTGKITHDIHDTLQKNGIESIVCYGRGRKIKEPYVYKTSSEIIAKFNNIKSRFTGLAYSGCWLATWKLISIIKKEKPDIVHLQCINGFFVNIYKLLCFLKKAYIPTVLTLHAEFMYTGNCGHAYECDRWKIGCGHCTNLKGATGSYCLDRTNIAWRKMKMAFEEFKNLQVVSVSKWVQERAQQSPILKKNIHTTILNGIECRKIFRKKNVTYLKVNYNIQNEKVILHVTADFSNHAKGGNYIIDLANRLIDKNIKVILIGNTDHTLSLPGNIIDVGRVEDQEKLAEYYSLADLTVITSRKETFSMPVAESLCCGTPVIGFKAGGPESIAISEYSEFVEYGNIEQLEKVLWRWIDKKNILKNIDIVAHEKYSKEKMIEEYLKIYNKISVVGDLIE